ncbi:hypothetical protein ISCGN_018157 [Ixodes scapularis]
MGSRTLSKPGTPALSADEGDVGTGCAHSPPPPAEDTLEPVCAWTRETADSQIGSLRCTKEQGILIWGEVNGSTPSAAGGPAWSRLLCNAVATRTASERLGQSTSSVDDDGNNNQDQRQGSPATPFHRPSEGIRYPLWPGLLDQGNSCWLCDVPLVHPETHETGGVHQERLDAVSHYGRGGRSPASPTRQARPAGTRSPGPDSAFWGPRRHHALSTSHNPRRTAPVGFRLRPVLARRVAAPMACLCRGYDVTPLECEDRRGARDGGGASSGAGSGTLAVRRVTSLLLALAQAGEARAVAAEPAATAAQLRQLCAV